MYLILTNRDNGDWPDSLNVESVTQKELIERLRRGDFGANPKFLTEWPNDDRVNSDEYIIVYARVVVPKLVERVVKQEWELP